MTAKGQKRKVYLLVVLPLLIVGALVVYFAFTRDTGPAPAGEGYTDLKLTGDFDRKWTFKDTQIPPSSLVAGGDIIYMSQKGIGAVDAATGQQLWSIADVARSEFATGDGMLAYSDQYGYLKTVDAGTGVELWNLPEAAAGVDKKLTISNGVIYEGMQKSAVRALDSSGREIWKATAGNPISEIGLTDRTVFIAGVQDTGAPQQKSYVLSLDRGDGRQKWSFVGEGREIEVAGGHNAVFLSSRQQPTFLIHSLTALDAETGAIIWRKTDRDYTAPVFIDDRLYVIAAAGQEPAVMLAIDPQSGQEIWNCQLPDAERAAGTVAASGELIYFKGLPGGSLNAVDRETGQLRWRARLDAPVRLGPIVADDSLCFTYGDGATVYALPLPG